MKLSARTLEKLVEIITGNSKESPYRSGPQLIQFFHDFGERDVYGQGFPARHAYTLEKLNKHNGADSMRAIVMSAMDFFGVDGFDPEAVASVLNRLLQRDGFRLVLEYRRGWMEGDKHVRADPYFEVRALGPPAAVPENLTALTHDAIQEQIRKINAKVDSGDFAGAIANTYTLVETFLKQVLLDLGVQHKEEEGDIRELYRLIRDALNLNPKGEALENHLKAILEGLQKIVGGLYEVANKGSDRHARRYHPARHHAKLAVNAAFSLCEFILDTKAYQESRTGERQAS
jgi:hypothetical protein